MPKVLGSLRQLYGILKPTHSTFSSIHCTSTVCFFGRGLIQLTGKGNYEKYGEKIGVDLLNNGDLAMDPINSYKIASVYMRGRTFIYVTNPSAKFTTKHGSWTGLEAARRSVNGGTKEMDKINNAYNAWVTVLKESKAGAV